MPRDVTGRVPESYYEPQLFGSNLVVALPSTVHGHFWERRQIDELLAHGQVISIAEHIAPIRPDGRIQTPNIIDDMGELRRLFNYLSGKDIWYATGSEIASYVVAREHSLIYDVTDAGFSIRYDERLERPWLTLFIDSAAICQPELPRITVTLPTGAVVEESSCKFDNTSYRHQVTLPVMNGRYQVHPRAA
jgi:hypothetical protein